MSSGKNFENLVLLFYCEEEFLWVFPMVNVHPLVVSLAIFMFVIQVFHTIFLEGGNWYATDTFHVLFFPEIRCCLCCVWLQI
jgi:hypothetical protein